jgi:hypothetical protein
MLKFFRSKAVTKAVLWILLILILPAFVMWGTASISRSKEKGPTFVGTIDGKKISFDDFYEQILGVRCQLILNYGNQPEVLRELARNMPLVAKIAWRRLVMLQEAKRYEVVVNDKEVVGYLQSHPLFMRNGKFDDKIYAYILRYNVGLSPRSFEETIRKNLQITKLETLLTKDVSVSDEEAVREFDEEYKKVKVKYIFLQVKEPAPSPTPNAAPGTATAQARTACREEADRIHKNITSLMNEGKETFEDACTKLALNVREPGLFARGETIEGLGDATALWNAASALKEGDVSVPIPVKDGCVILKVVEFQKPDADDLNEKKEECSKNALKKKRSKMLDAWFERLALNTRLNINLDEIDKYYR